ncbi:hypothetical protein D3C75_1242060 [compost metagenome]
MFRSSRKLPWAILSIRFFNFSTGRLIVRVRYNVIIPLSISTRKQTPSIIGIQMLVLGANCLPEIVCDSTTPVRTG